MDDYTTPTKIDGQKLSEFTRKVVAAFKEEFIKELKGRGLNELVESSSQGNPFPAFCEDEKEIKELAKNAKGSVTRQYLDNADYSLLSTCDAGMETITTSALDENRKNKEKGVERMTVIMELLTAEYRIKLKEFYHLISTIKTISLDELVLQGFQKETIQTLLEKYDAQEKPRGKRFQESYRKRLKKSFDEILKNVSTEHSQQEGSIIKKIFSGKFLFRMVAVAAGVVLFRFTYKTWRRQRLLTIELEAAKILLNHPDRKDELLKTKEELVQFVSFFAKLLKEATSDKQTKS